MKNLILNKEYDFLRNHENLGNHIQLLTLGGSHAYGTNIEGSDIDIRGMALNSKYNILTNENFEQVVNKETDTTIYSFNKLITLLSNCNPNTIEMLGCRPEHYLYIGKIGQELLDNTSLFLSKRAIGSFGGYASAQLRRLENLSIRDAEQEKREQHILNSILNLDEYLEEKYNMKSNCYIDKSDKEDMDKEIFIDINLKHYPLRNFNAYIGETNQVINSYNSIGKRNSRAIEHNKINKHMLHLVRLYYMVFDILENEKVVTYREKEHDLLMSIRNNEYLNEDNSVKPEFYELVNELDKRFEYTKKNTSLPNKPNYKLIKDWTASVNERIVKGEI